MRGYWYWPGWKGGNTKNRVGKGDKVLILGDYLGPQEVGEGRIVSISLMMRRGGRTVSISRGGEGDITSLVEVNQACLLFLEDTNRAPRV